MVLRHRLVHRSPGNVSVRPGLPDEELVLRRPPGVKASPAGQRAVGRELGFVAAQGFFVELGGFEVAMRREASNECVNG